MLRHRRAQKQLLSEHPLAAEGPGLASQALAIVEILAEVVLAGAGPVGRGRGQSFGHVTFRGKISVIPSYAGGKVEPGTVLSSCDQETKGAVRLHVVGAPRVPRARRHGDAN